MTKLLQKSSALVGLLLLLLPSARAVSLSVNEGLSGAIGGMVGTIDPGSPASLADEVGYINHLLGLGANATDTVTDFPHSWNYDTTAYDFNGSVSATGALDYTDSPPLSGPAGYEYVLAKFGNTAYVWYIGGEGFTLPSDLEGIKGSGLSHWAAFNLTGTNVPDGGTTAVLVGLGLVGMSFIARRRTAS